MTIKEMEDRTGMERANIRFYEKEGLLSPSRLANGYRDYSEEDVETLMRIKLLRSLRMPLEDIRALQLSEKTLSDTLRMHLQRLTEEKELLSAAENWAREQDCREFASDCELDNVGSLHFHLNVGFQEVNRIICFTKKL